MKFIWTKDAKNDITFNSESIKRYQNAIISGEHLHFKKDWGDIIFSGELYPDPSVTLTVEKQLLQAIDEHGIEAISQLNGKFTSIILRADEVYVIRDQTGVHNPIYYNDKHICNSFDLLLKSNAFDPEINVDAVGLYLTQGFIEAPYTVFKHLKKLSPFQHIKYTKSGFQVADTLNYTSFKNIAESNNASIEEVVSEYEKIHKDAIGRRINNKKNISLLLSGGYDSGGNIASLRAIYDGPITAYSVGFKNSDFSELPLAEIMANEFKAKLVPLYLDGKEIDDLPNIISAFEEPFFENGMFINYKVAQSIDSNSTDIILGGDGNDQFFGTSSREIALNILSRKTGLIWLQKLFKGISSFIPGIPRLKFHNETILYPSELQHFGFSKSEIKHLFGRITIPSGISDKKPTSLNFAEQYLWRNYFTDLEKAGLQVITHKASRFATQANLNISFPYADNKLLNFVNSLKVNHKVHGTFKELLKGQGKSKYVLKAYLKDILPKEITNRKKQGGFAPLSIYLDDEVFRQNVYTLLEKVLPETGFFNEKAVKKLLEDIENSLQDKSVWFWQRQKQQIKLMYFLVFAIWFRIYITQDKRPKLADYFE
jgi:asparagine synthase (glutamine-hydrolysing)